MGLVVRESSLLGVNVFAIECIQIKLEHNNCNDNDEDVNDDDDDNYDDDKNNRCVSVRRVVVIKSEFSRISSPVTIYLDFKATHKFYHKNQG